MELPQIALGRRLRQARLSRGLTIGDVSALTKISTRALLAIECENFDRLPGGIFRRAYVLPLLTPWDSTAASAYARTWRHSSRLQPTRLSSGALDHRRRWTGSAGMWPRCQLGC